MQHFILIQGLISIEDIPDIPQSLRLWKFSNFLQLLVQIATITEIIDKIMVILSLNQLVERDYILAFANLR